MERPGVGIGVIIQNSKGEILVGKRKGSHSPFYSIPGGHLELGETFEEAAIKEVMEETGLTLLHPKVIGVTNNLRTYAMENKHYVSVILLATDFEGELQVMEPLKCESWFWCFPPDIPKPHFDASEFAVECWLNNQFYIPGQL